MLCSAASSAASRSLLVADGGRTRNRRLYNVLIEALTALVLAASSFVPRVDVEARDRTTKDVHSFSPHQASWTIRSLQMQYVKASEFGNVLEGHSGGVAALTFSPNGACLASAGLDAKVCIWNVSNGALLHVFVGASPMLSLTWVKDGELLCGAEDGSISVVSTSAVCGSSCILLHFG